LASGTIFAENCAVARQETLNRRRQYGRTWRPLYPA
jgi:hypothetical protein